jgi:glycosyltransferase involved in cell wall biosynthesis
MTLTLGMRDRERSTVTAPVTRLPRPLIKLLIAVKRAGLRVIRAGLVRYVRAAPPPGDGAAQDPVKVYIFLVSAWGMGGTIRAAINLAGYLADRYEVEIVSTYRRSDEPYFAFDPRVKLVALDDQRAGAVPRLQRPLRAVLRRFSSAIYHPADIRKHNHNLWTDLQLVRHMRRAEGIAIASRPGHIIQLADLALPGVITVGLEQMNLHSHAKNLRRAMIRRYRELDALAVLTDQDREAYERALNGSAPPMWRLPNTVRAIEPPRADLSAKRIFAAGRYTPQKGYDFLIHAFAPVARKHPDWELKIFGRGQTKSRLQARIDQEGIGEQATLAGPTDDVPGEMAQASIYVLSSRFEGFPLVLVEAMSKGMACVAFDCPTGPADIVDDHRNGLLVPAKDVEGLTAALLEMVEDEELRRRCGDAAIETARDYTMATIGPRWEEMLQALLREHAGHAG